MGFFSQTQNVHVDQIEGLLQANLDVLYRVALRYTRDASSAQDLVQDAAIRCLRFRHRYTPGTNFRAWSLTILTNIFRQQYRRLKHERSILLDPDAVEQVHGSHPGTLQPEEAFFDGLLGDEVTHALDKLGDDHRAVLVLCDLEGVSYKDASDILDVPIGTVMSRLYRARRLVRLELHGLAVERGFAAQEKREENDENVLPLRREWVRKGAS